MDVNVVIISKNHTTLDFWRTLVKPSLRKDVIMLKMTDFNLIRHFISTNTIVIIDEYFTSPNSDEWILKTASSVRRLNNLAKIYAVSPIYADTQNCLKKVFVRLHRFPLCNEFISDFNKSIENRLFNYQRIAV